MSIGRFEDLKSWQEARKLAGTVFQLTERDGFRSRGLAWQLQDAAGSCMGNIAEAHGRYAFENTRRSLDVSLGSCKELQSCLYIALDQVYVRQAEFDAAYRQADIVGRLIYGTPNNQDRQIASRSVGKRGPRGHPRSPGRIPRTDG